MFDRSGGKASLIGLLGCVLSAALSAIAYGQTAGFVAPPRNISDITAILDQQRADPSRAARARAEADANPPAGAAAGALGQFYFNRCQARAAVGRNRDSIDDCEKAISYGGDYVNQVSRYQQFLSNQYRSLGEFKRSIEIEQQMARKFEEIERNRGGFSASTYGSPSPISTWAISSRPSSTSRRTRRFCRNPKAGATSPFT